MTRTEAVVRRVLRGDYGLQATEETLLGAGVAPFTELPVWVPSDSTGAFSVSIDRALAAGLGLRPLADTVRDTLRWDATRPRDLPMRAGLTPEREAELLALATSPTP